MKRAPSGPLAITLAVALAFAAACLGEPDVARSTRSTAAPAGSGPASTGASTPQAGTAAPGTAASGTASAATATATSAVAPGTPSAAAPGTPAATVAPTSSATQPPTPTSTPNAAAVTILAAGDIAECGGDGDEATAALLAARPGLPILTMGDNAYPDGAAQDFANCFGPSWGPHRARIYPSPGNHEYRSRDANPYFDYFGDRAGTRGLGYYSFDLGAWHVIALNSERDNRAGGRQLAWLQADLAANTKPCVLAYWHKPRFTAGEYSDLSDGAAFWTTLANAGAEIVLNGHDHNYQRYQPMDANGAPSPNGVREFVVGTGGKDRYGLSADPRREAGTDKAWGVLELTLRADGYDWRFLPVAGASFADSGSGSCR